MKVDSNSRQFLIQCLLCLGVRHYPTNSLIHGLKYICNLLIDNGGSRALSAPGSDPAVMNMNKFGYDFRFDFYVMLEFLRGEGNGALGGVHDEGHGLFPCGKHITNNNLMAISVQGLACFGNQELVIRFQLKGNRNASVLRFTLFHANFTLNETIRPLAAQRLTSGVRNLGT